MIYRRRKAMGLTGLLPSPSPEQIKERHQQHQPVLPDNADIRYQRTATNRAISP